MATDQSTTKQTPKNKQQVDFENLCRKENTLRSVDDYSGDYLDNRHTGNWNGSEADSVDVLADEFCALQIHQNGDSAFLEPPQEAAMAAGHAGYFESDNVSTHNNDEESDEQLAAELQVQMNAEFIRDQKKFAEVYQMEENEQAQFESQQLAASFQMCDTLVSEEVDQSLADRLQTEEADHVAEGDQEVASTMVKEDLSQQAIEFESEQLAASFQMCDTMVSEEVDQSLAERLQIEEADHVAVGDQEVASTMVKEDLSQQAIDDERIAWEMYNRDMAYQTQMESDVEFAQRLADEEHSKPGPQQTQEMGMGLHPAWIGGMAQQQQRSEPDRGLHPFLHRDITDGGASLFPFSPDMQQQGGNNLIQEMLRGGGAQQDIGDILDNIPQDDYEALWQLEERMGEVKDRGMKDEEINTLPTSRYSGAPQGACAAASADEDNTQCKVCLSDFENGQTLRTLPCLHKYHKDCIDQWIKSNATCPVCRGEIKEEIVQAAH